MGLYPRGVSDIPTAHALRYRGRKLACELFSAGRRHRGRRKTPIDGRPSPEGCDLSRLRCERHRCLPHAARGTGQGALLDTDCRCAACARKRISTIFSMAGQIWRMRPFCYGTMTSLTWSVPPRPTKGWVCRMLSAASSDGASMIE